MKRNYNLNHRLIAFVLLVALFLQSCGNSLNQLTPKVETFSNHTVQQPTHSINIDLLKDQELSAERGYLVTLHESDNGMVQADVRADRTQKEPNYRNLPVVMEKGIDLARLRSLDRITQQQHVQFQLSQSGQPGRVIVTKGGLLGGMKTVRKKGDGDKVQEKEREKEKEKENKAEDNFSNYPRLLELAIQGNGEAQFKLGKRAYEAWCYQYREESCDEAKVWLAKARDKNYQGAIRLLEEIERKKKKKN